MYQVACSSARRASCRAGNWSEDVRDVGTLSPVQLVQACGDGGTLREAGIGEDGLLTATPDEVQVAWPVRTGVRSSQSSWIGAGLPMLMTRTSMAGWGGMGVETRNGGGWVQGEQETG